MGDTVYYRGDASELVQTIRGFIGTLAGQGNVGAELTDGVQIRVANALLSEIEQAFLVKSRGGTDAAGIKWKPLERETIAKRRLGPGDEKTVNLKARAAGFTEAERRRMARDIHARTGLMMAKFGLSHGQAAGLARSHVENRWRQKIKVYGGIYDNKFAGWRLTKHGWRLESRYGSVLPASQLGRIAYKIDILGSRDVDILRDTGLLAGSFSPGIDANPSGAEGQVLRTGPGIITVGTHEKPWHHKTRPFWPKDGALPDQWWDTMLRAANRGIQEAVVTLVRGAA